MPDSEISDVVVYSEEMQDVVGEVPSWIIRSGITVIFLLFILFLIGSWFFKYPDILLSNIIINTKNPPVFLVAKSSGKLEKLFVKNNQLIKRNEIIAMIENNTNYSSVFELKKLLSQVSPCLKNGKYSDLSKVNLNLDSTLGSLQEYFEQLKKNIENLKQFDKLNYYKSKKRKLVEEAWKYGNYISSKQLNISTLEREVQLAENKFKRAKELEKIGLISKEKLENQETEYLRVKQNLNTAKADLINIRLQHQKLFRTIFEFDIEYKEKNKKIILDLNESLKNLNSKIVQWEKSYLIISPVNGEVSFTSYWSENQYIKAGEKVFAVVPKNKSKIIGKVKLPIRSSGKVKIGQQINIKLDNYPYMEFGIVKGVIVSKSLIPEDNQYIIEVRLPFGLKTNYNKELKFYPEMKGTAEIITEDIRLLERFISPIRSIFKN